MTTEMSTTGVTLTPSLQTFIQESLEQFEKTAAAQALTYELTPEKLGELVTRLETLGSLSDKDVREMKHYLHRLTPELLALPEAIAFAMHLLRLGSRKTATRARLGNLALHRLYAADKANRTRREELQRKADALRESQQLKADVAEFDAYFDQLLLSQGKDLPPMAQAKGEPSPAETALANEERRQRLERKLEQLGYFELEALKRQTHELNADLSLASRDSLAKLIDDIYSLILRWTRRLSELKGSKLISEKEALVQAVNSFDAQRDLFFKLRDRLSSVLPEQTTARPAPLPWSRLSLQDMLTVMNREQPQQAVRNRRDHVAQQLTQLLALVDKTISELVPQTLIDECVQNTEKTDG